MDVRTAVAVATTEFMEKSDWRISANRIRSIDKTASEMSMSHGQKQCKNGTKLNVQTYIHEIAKYEKLLTTSTVKSVH